MKRNHKIISVFLILVSLCAAIFALSACGEDISEIVVGRNDMPRLTYVEGQELDFSTGQITVKYGDGSTKTVALSSPDISVSGYDKNTAGRQQITLTYKEMTTTIDVMVIARIAAENVQTFYYVGEPSLKLEKGKIRIANDDGTTFVVSLSDEAITLSGFDSSKAVDSQTISVRYQKDGADYTGSFAVSIISSTNTKFTNPVKTVYRTHETLDVLGAQIAYTNGDAQYNKIIAVTKDMVSGADFSLATEENDQANPLVQHITVKYGNDIFGFDISIIYSDVTRLKKLLDEVKYTNEKPVLDEENGERLITCAKLYCEAIPYADRSYFDKNVINTVLSGAAEYAYGKWSAALDQCEHSFMLKEEGVVYVLESYTHSKTDLTTLLDETAPINQYLSILQTLADVSDLKVGDVAVKDYVLVALSYANVKEKIVTVLTDATTIYSKLENIPEEWTTLSAYGEQIDAVRDALVENVDAGYREVYSVISSWRPKNDFFDIVYAYYIETDDFESIEEIKDIVLPHVLEEVYNDFMSSLVQYAYISQGYISDTTLFVNYFRKALDGGETVKNGEDGLNKTLYETLKFNRILSDSETGESVPVSLDELFVFMKSTESGYYALIGMILDDPILVAVWEDYLALLKVTSDEEVAAKLPDFVHEFAMLSAPQQRVFLLSMNVYYFVYDTLALDTDMDYTYFLRLMTAYYSEELSEAEFGMFHNLLLAIENYTRINDDENAITDFLANMSEIKVVYDDASIDTSKFKNEFNDIYRKYTEIAEKYNADGTLKKEIQLDEEWQDVFSALRNEILFELQAYNVLVEDDEELREDSYIRIMASYERAKRIVAKILSDETPASVKEAYTTNSYAFGNLSWTLEYAFNCQAMGIGMLAYTQISVLGESLWEVIASETEIRNFFASAGYILWLGDADDSPVFPEADQEAIVDVMRAFLELAPQFRYMFVQLQAMDEKHEYYYEGLQTFFASIFEGEQSLCDVAELLMDAEKAYIEYRNLLYEEENGDANRDPETSDEEQEGPKTSAEALEIFKTSMEAYFAAYTDLNEEAHAAFELLSDIYGYYTAEYNRLFEEI